jgi:hypothetical protein
LFNSWYWNRKWWSFYSNLGELSIIVVRVDGVVEGIAPLYLCSTKALKLVTVKTLRFIGSGGDTSPDDLGVLYSDNYEEMVVAAVCQCLLTQT